MQLTFKTIFATVALLLGAIWGVAQAAGPYTEDQFLTQFSGQSKKIIVDKLGQPNKKELSVKPSGASIMMQKAGVSENKSKPVKVEMWYYYHIVKYDPKRTYKETEITFVNDRATSIAFFNNR